MFYILSSSTSTIAPKLLYTSASTMPALREHIAAASERYSSDFKYNGLASPPSNQFIFVTCMDARIDTSQAFGIGVGEAHVIRNVRFTP